MGCCCAKLEQRIEEKFDSSNQILRKELYTTRLIYRKHPNECCFCRGNGALVLTPDRLWFSLLCPADREIEIPLRSILGVKETNRFMGGGRFIAGPAMIIIDFQDLDSGIEDEVVFSVRGKAEWREAIERARVEHVAIKNHAW